MSERISLVALRKKIAAAEAAPVSEVGVLGGYEPVQLLEAHEVRALVVAVEAAIRVNGVLADARAGCWDLDVPRGDEFLQLEAALAPFTEESL